MIRISNIFSRRNRALLGELVRTDFKLRYQGSVLGYMWSLLKPLFLFGILYMVFGLILRFGRDIPHYPVYLLLGIVLWSFFDEATKQGASAIISRGSLIRKINFPKYIIVISTSVSALINLGLSLIAVLVFIVVSGADVQPAAVVIVPLLIIELYVLALAVAFFLSAVNVKFRDVQHVWDIVIRAGFYATPIIYPIGLVASQSEFLARLMLMLNPVGRIIQGAREVLVTPQTQTLADLSPSYWVYAAPLGVIATIALLAMLYFRKRSKYFAEEV